MSDAGELVLRRRTVPRAGAALRIVCAAVLLVSCSALSQHAVAAADVTSTPEFRVVIGGTTLTGRLFDNATARDLSSQLPMSLTFGDLHGVEKGAPLPRPLSTDGMPAGDDPEIGDLGYWAPGNNLVLYYGDVGFWNGIQRIGHFDGDMQAIAAQSADFAATIELTG